MTLVRRVSLFFLAALGLTLAVNAALIAALLDYWLHSQFHGQMHAAFHTLVAAVEVENDDVKWEPSDHTIAIGAEDGLDDIRWWVLDEEGRAIDHSRNLVHQQQPTEANPHPVEMPADHTNWIQLTEKLSAAEPKPFHERDDAEHSWLTVVVARSPEAMHARWAWAVGVLVVVSLITWALAALGGTWYCRKALAPVRDMVHRVTSMKAMDFKDRLPDLNRRDELAELTAAFNALRSRMQLAFEKQQRFAGDAAHQLRTPLTVLRGQIDVALRRPRSEGEYQQTMTLLRTQTEELQRLVEALLFLARSQGEAVLPDVRTLNVQDWLRDVADRWKSDPRHGDLVFTSESLQVSTSWTLLSQLVDNLISNALKYSTSGTPVSMTVKSAGPNLTIDIDDEGPGVAPDDRSSLFEPFFRSATVRSRGIPGVGLGLSIAATIARALGGTLGHIPLEPHGSRFRVTIPINL